MKSILCSEISAAKWQHTPSLSNRPDEAVTRFDFDRGLHLNCSNSGLPWQTAAPLVLLQALLNSYNIQLNYSSHQIILFASYEHCQVAGRFRSDLLG